MTIKALLMLSLLSLNSQILAMEKTIKAKKDRDAKENILKTRSAYISTIGGLDIELWEIIFYQLYFQPSILDKAHDIYEGATALQKEIPTYYKIISLVCKGFKLLNIPWTEFKEKVHQFYIPHLNQRFLESRATKEGLYPKKSEWGLQNKSEQIATFISGHKFNSCILANVLQRAHPPHTLVSKDLINVLLFYGANVNTPNHDGQNPLYLAVDHHHTRNNNNKTIIELLLIHGANVNICNSFGYTPLITAVINHDSRSNNHRDILILLLKYGAHVNIQTLQGNTALTLALRNHDVSESQDNEDIIILLLSHGGNPHLKAHDGKTPRDIARQKFNKKFITTHFPSKHKKSSCIIS